MFKYGLRRFLAAGILCLLLSGEAHACPWGPFGRDVVHPLDEIPESVPFVGFAVVQNRSQFLLEMRVTEPVRGFEVGDELLLKYDTSNCSRNPAARQGERFFIAGSFIGRYFFSLKNREIMLRDNTARSLAACIKNGCDPKRRRRLENILERRNSILERAANNE